MNEKNDLEQEFLLELQAREFLQWKMSLTDENSIEWVEALMDQINILDIEVEELKAELEIKEFYQGFFVYFMFFLFIAFIFNFLKWVLFS